MAERDARLLAAAGELLTSSHGGAGAMAVVRDGEIAFAHGVGSASDGPATEDTLFRIGSVGKMITALAVLRAVDQGLLDLDAPTTRWLPDADPRITLRLLLSHRAGVPDRGGCEPGLDTPSAFARAHAADPLWTPPGAVFSYSNAGMAFAAGILEIASGRSFASYVETEIFANASMPTATYDAARAASRSHAQAHAVGGAPIDDLPSCGLLQGAGAAWVSARELAELARVMLGGGAPLISPARFAEMTTPQIDVAGNGEEYYGFGLFMRARRDYQIVFHPGGMPGFASFLGWVPSARFAFAGVIDVGHASVLPGSVFDLYVPSATPLAPRPVDGASLPAYAGTYEDTRGALGRFRIELDGGALRMVPLGGQRFWPWPADFTGTFWPDQSGATHWLSTRAGAAERVP